MPQGQTESGAILLAAICWATNAQRRCYPTWHCAYRPVSHLLIVNNSSFSLSLAVLSLSLSRKNGSVNGADRQRFGPSCVLLKHVSQGRTERMRIHVINFSTTGNSLDLLETWKRRLISHHRASRRHTPRPSLPPTLVWSLLMFFPDERATVPLCVSSVCSSGHPAKPLTGLILNSAYAKRATYRKYYLTQNPSPPWAPIRASVTFSVHQGKGQRWKRKKWGGWRGEYGYVRRADRRLPWTKP